MPIGLIDIGIQTSKDMTFFKSYGIKALPLQALIYQCSIVYYKL